MNASLFPNRRQFLATGAAAVGATPLLADAHSTVNSQLSWLNSVQFGGRYIAARKGYRDAEALDVSLIQDGPNAPVDPPVVSGTALMGISAADYIAAAVAQAAPFKIIAGAMQKNPFEIASLAANPVNTPADLIGKRIGMAVFKTPILRALCTLNHIDINQIEIVSTQDDPAPLVTGQVDCLLCWATDLPVAMTIKGIENITMLMADHGYAIHSLTYIATEDSIANRRAVTS
ncbi:NMT1/THI5 like protein [Yoonia sediminilitoris]|uniref:Thiamine pyrimidine synthase n=1 Tax=Yoonia sediminilitoris TaxID=1286148 RepID=A0A2T6KRR7_9RHOB|nr:NMT1/THI5 like protein [Yoonia sediminilitoris]RCW99405.1 NMT1/THI5 like protein [Yoonia sediminilitoris]